MKSFILLILVSFNLFTAEIVSCDKYNNTIPQIIKQHKAPAFGHYIKKVRRYISDAKNDPFPEEILYLLIVMDLSKENKQLGTAKDYERFHSYFRKEMKQIENMNNGQDGGKKKLYPVIKSFLQKNMIKDLTEEKFNSIIKVSEKKIEKLREIFTSNSNPTFYKILPRDAKVTLDMSLFLPVATLRTDTHIYKHTFTSSRLKYFKSIHEEHEYQKEEIKKYREELEYIYSVLPIKNSLLKGNLSKLLKKE